MFISLSLIWPKENLLLMLLSQTKAQVEKSRQTLESDNLSLQSELKQIAAARQDADKKRKLAEQQVADLLIKLSDMEKVKIDSGDKASKLQVWLIIMSY